jgi:threonine aldolase
MNESWIDLRSDTVTLPTDEMRDAMRSAVVGDSMRGEDPTTNALEELAAQMVGKEEAIFVSSGTQGNLVCLMAHTHPGEEVIFEADAHAFYYEVGSYAALAGLSPRFVKGHFGVMEPAAIEAALRPPSPFFPPTRLFCMENTHNRGGGNAIRLEEMAAMTEVARRHGLAIHLDGARIFNAAIALGVDAKAIAQYADSVMFCLSKGLSAPMGSLVAGSHDFMQRARRARKMLGGDLRQSGVVAAAGIVALRSMVQRLADDHGNAALLAAHLGQIPGLVLDAPPCPTNMVFVGTEKLGMDAAQFVAAMRAQHVLCVVYGPTRVRFVTHRHIQTEDISVVVEAARKVAAAA